MAVQHFDHNKAQELFFGQGGNQHRKRRSIVCRAFLGVFLIGWRLLNVSRLVVVGLLYDWQGDEG
jgi:hypothetical protein